MSASSFLDLNRFQLVFEIEPPRRPDIAHVREQIEVLAPVADAFLVPDNHLGRATVSSVAVAHEVTELGGNAIACVNARDRNVLGFRRDLLTSAAYGVDHFLFVYGDSPREGRRSEDLTVRGMLDEVRSFGSGSLFSGYPQFRAGTVARINKPLTWRARADFLFVQVTFATKRLIQWRESLAYDGPVYAAVLVLSSTRMARRVNAGVPDIHVPETIIDKLDDRALGVDLALRQIQEIKDSGAFSGVHVIPVTRFREVAARVARLSL